MGLALQLSGTDALLAAAFAHSALITAQQAGEVLGLDEKTFRALVEAGAIRAVRIGMSDRSRRYTEADLRAYLAGETELTECRSTNQRKAASGSTTSSSRVVAFTARPARLRVARPKP